MTGRRLVEALLVAALVPVGVVGVQTWRDAGSEPAPRVVAPVIQRPARPQLGRFTSRQAFDGPSWPAAEAESARAEHHVRSDLPTIHERPHGSAAVAERPHAGHMVVARLDRPGQSAETPSRRGGGAGLPGSNPLAATSMAGGGSAAGSLVAVEFVGVMQDLTLLKRNDFVADLVRQLKIIVYWKVSGNHAQRLELFTPEGVLYRRIATDFTGTSVTGTGTPVETVLPVGGSWITEHSLFGGWRLDVFLDGQPATTASFVLNP
jgi:hypothetical protein